MFNALDSGASGPCSVRVPTLARDVVLCSWQDTLLSRYLSPLYAHKWVPANLMLGDNPAMDWQPI